MAWAFAKAMAKPKDMPLFAVLSTAMEDRVAEFNSQDSACGLCRVEIGVSSGVAGRLAGKFENSNLPKSQNPKLH